MKKILLYSLFLPLSTNFIYSKLSYSNNFLFNYQMRIDAIGKQLCQTSQFELALQHIYTFLDQLRSQYDAEAYQACLGLLQKASKRVNKPELFDKYSAEVAQLLRLAQSIEQQQGQSTASVKKPTPIVVKEFQFFLDHAVEQIMQKEDVEQGLVDLQLLQYHDQFEQSSDLRAKYVNKLKECITMLINVDLIKFYVGDLQLLLKKLDEAFVTKFASDVSVHERVKALVKKLAEHEIKQNYLAIEQAQALEKLREKEKPLFLLSEQKEETDLKKRKRREFKKPKVNAAKKTSRPKHKPVRSACEFSVSNPCQNQLANKIECTDLQVIAPARSTKPIKIKTTTSTKRISQSGDTNTKKVKTEKEPKIKASSKPDREVGGNLSGAKKKQPKTSKLASVEAILVPSSSNTDVVQLDDSNQEAPKLLLDFKNDLPQNITTIPSTSPTERVEIIAKKENLCVIDLS